jgi:hypothetical protein
MSVLNAKRKLNARSAQDQRSLYDRLLSVYQLANINGHYDAADRILNDCIKPIQAKEQRSKRIEARTARLTEEPRKGNS